MRGKLYIRCIAWMLLLTLAIQAVFPAEFVFAADNTQQTQTVIDVTDYGADPSGKEDSVIPIQKAIEAAKQAEGPVVLNFPKGTYNLWPDDATVRRIYISNSTRTDTPSNSIRTIGILLEDMQDVTIEGNGSELIYHGKMMSFAVIGCKNVTIQNLTYDFAEHYVVDITVESVTDNTADVYIPDSYDYEIVEQNGAPRIVFYGEYSPKTGERYWSRPDYPYGQVNEMMTGEIYRTGSGVIFDGCTSIEEIGNRRVRFHYSGKPRAKVGYNMQIKEVVRDNPSILLWESEDILLKDITAGFLHSFGIVGQFSKNITVDHVVVKSDARKGTMTAAAADSMQMSGCGGKILVKNCEFTNPQDDPINIHGTFLQIDQILAPNKAVVCYKHYETYGFPNYYPGDEVEFISRNNLNPVGTEEEQRAIVTEVENPDEDDHSIAARQRITLTFDRDLPAEILNGSISNYVVENITYTPEVEIRNCIFEQSPVRGVLCTTRKKVLIEDCIFRNMNMANIYISDDANNWYESGFFRDVTIRNNIFEGSNAASILVEPIVNHPDREKPLHQNLLIEGNTFLIKDRKAIQIKSVENVTICNNDFRVISDEVDVALGVANDSLRAGETMQMDLKIQSPVYQNRLIDVAFSKNVDIYGNTYGAGLNRGVSTSNMDAGEVDILNDELILNADNKHTDYLKDCTVQYFSSNESVIEIDEFSKSVRALTEGTASLYARVTTKDGKSWESNRIRLTVEGVAEGGALLVETDKYVLTKAGETAQLTAKSGDSFVQDARWSVKDAASGKDTDLAAVNEDGVLTAQGNGIVEVTAEAADGSTGAVLIRICEEKLERTAEIINEIDGQLTLNDADSMTQKVSNKNGFFNSSNNEESLITFPIADGSDFEAEVRFACALKSTYEEIGFGILKDVDNFVAVQEKNHLGVLLIPERKASGSESICINVRPKEGYFKIVKKGDQFEGYYRLIGEENWTKIGETDNADVGNEGLVLAMWAATANTNSPNEAVWSELKINGTAQPFGYLNQAPEASNARLSDGVPEVGKALSAVYDYRDPDGDTEGSSVTAWYVSDETDGTYTRIRGASSKSIKMFREYEGKYIKAEIIPTDRHGMSGEPVMTEAVGPVAPNSEEARKRIVVESDTDVLTEKEASLQLMAKQNGTELTDVSWSVKNLTAESSSVLAEIDENGLLTAKKSGVVEVMATAGDKTSGSKLIRIAPENTVMAATIVNEKPGQVSLNGLNSITQKSSALNGFYHSRNQEENLITFPIADGTNFEAEVKFNCVLKNTYEEFGIAIFKDMDNYTAVTEKNHHGLVLIPEAGAAADENIKIGDKPSEGYFRIVKKDNHFEGYYRVTKEEEWKKIGEADNAAVGNDDLFVGLWAASAHNTPNQATWSDLKMNGEPQPFAYVNTAPTASEVTVSSESLATGQTIAADWQYQDADKNAEGRSVVAWYMADSEDGEYALFYAGTEREITIPAKCRGKYIRVQVIPTDALDMPGAGVFSKAVGPVAKGSTGSLEDDSESMNAWLCELSAGDLPIASDNISEFDYHTLRYMTGVPAETEKLVVKAAAQSGAAQIKVTANGEELGAQAGAFEQEITLLSGFNTVKLEVTSPNQAVTREYQLIIIRNAYTDTALSDIKVNGKSIEGFTPDQKEYDILADKPTEVTIEAAAKNARARVVIYDGNQISGNGTLTSVSKPGKNDYIIAVTSESQVKAAYYTVHVRVKKDDNANLEKASFNRAKMDTYFDTARTHYTLQALAPSVDFSFTAEEPGAAVTVAGNGTEITAEDGTAEGTIPLYLGENNIFVTVISPDLTEKTYTFAVNAPQHIYLSDMKWETAESGWSGHPVQKDKTVDGAGISLQVDGTVRQFEKGIGTHADSVIVYDIEGMGYTRLTGFAGVDASRNGLGTVSFAVRVDGEERFKTDTLTSRSNAAYIDLDVTGAKKIELIADRADGSNSSDHADFADMKLSMGLTEKECICDISNLELKNQSADITAGADRTIILKAKAGQEEACPMDGHAQRELICKYEILSDTTKSAQLKDDILIVNKAGTVTVGVKARLSGSALTAQAQAVITVTDITSAAQTEAKKEMLSIVYRAYEKLNTSAYTEESAASLQSALAAAETVINQADASKEAVEQALASLMGAASSLVYDDTDLKNAVDAAQRAADTAKIAADRAESAAAENKEAARKAQSTADAAQQKANTAEQEANTAKQEANTAGQKAEQAQQKANKAEADAAIAKAEAEAAGTGSTEAKEKAEKAEQEAAEAKAKAEAAKTAAAEAKTKAEALETAAAEAKTEAEAAKTAAAEAKILAEALEKEAADLKTRAEAIEKEAKEVKAKAEAVERETQKLKEELEAAEKEAAEAKKRAEEAEKEAAKAKKKAEAAEISSAEAKEASKLAQLAREAAQAAQKAAEEAQIKAATVEKAEFVSNKMELNKVKSTKKAQARLSWKKVAKAEGYVIQYDTKVCFEHSKKLWVKNGKKTQINLKKLKRGRKYYFRVKAYRTYNGVRIYTKYSKKQGVRIK